MAKKKAVVVPSNDLIKILIMVLLLLAIPMTVLALRTFVLPIGEAAPPDKAGRVTGNGAPSGPHYNLNILGKPKDKTADMTGTNGHVIFVPLEGKAKINLSEGDDFLVLDANATDGPAAFQLPNPDPDNDGKTTYSVWVRALGKPGGSASMNTCATTTDPETGLVTEWCSVETMVAVRDAGGSKFSDVSKQLLYVYVDLNLDGSVERYPLFDSALEGYFWNYDNKGLRNLQMRFYQVMSDVN